MTLAISNLRARGFGTHDKPLVWWKADVYDRYKFVGRARGTGHVTECDPAVDERLAAIAKDRGYLLYLVVRRRRAEYMHNLCKRMMMTVFRLEEDAQDMFRVLPVMFTDHVKRNLLAEYGSRLAIIYNEVHGSF